MVDPETTTTMSPYLTACTGMGAFVHAGLAFSNAGLGAVHAMAHALGGLKDLAHGECHSLLVDHVIAFNFKTSAQRDADIGVALGMNLAREEKRDLLREIRAGIHHLKDTVGISRTLGSIGVLPSEIGQLAKNAINDPRMITNPRVPTVRDIEVVYEEAL